MITLYYDVSSTPSRRAILWFESHNIEVCKKRIDYIKKADLIKFLFWSKNGFSDILINPNKARSKYLKQMKHLDELNFNRGVDFVIKHPHLLKVPLILEGDKVVIGFNAEDIRVFLSKKYRDLEVSFFLGMFFERLLPLSGHEGASYFNHGNKDRTRIANKEFLENFLFLNQLYLFQKKKQI